MSDPDDLTRTLLAEAGFVRRLAGRLVRDAATADDVSQDVLVAALSQSGPPNSWRRWLSVVTRRRATAARRARELSNADGLDEHVAAKTGERVELQRDLTDAVAGLPEPYRTVVTMRFFDELPPREIARRTGTDGAVVRQRLHRALALLRDGLDRRHGSRRAWVSAFSALGLGGTSVLGPVAAGVMMKKVSVAAVAAFAVGCTLWFGLGIRGDEAPPALGNIDVPVMAHAEHGHEGRGRPGMSVRADASDSDERRVVRIVRSDGRPIAGTSVSVDIDGDVRDLTADDDGRVALTAAGTAELLARAEGFAPAHRRLDAGIAEHVVVLGPAHTLTVQLVIDGEPAEAGFPLTVRDDAAQTFAPEMSAELQQVLAASPARRVEAGNEGWLRLDGLWPGWRGTLELPAHLWLLPQSGGTAAAHEAAQLAIDDGATVVHVTHVPTIYGRMFWGDDGSPVRDGGVNVIVDFVGEGTGGICGARCDPQGRFVHGLWTGSSEGYDYWCKPEARPLLRRVRFHVDVPGATADQRFERSAEELAAGPIELRIQRAPVSHFLAVDPAGTPVAGVVVASRSMSRPADAEGRGTFLGRLDDVQSVGAVGWSIGPPSVLGRRAGTDEDPIVFEVCRANSVSISVPRDGREFDRVLLRTPRAPFPGALFLSHLNQHLHDRPFRFASGGAPRRDGAWTYRAELRAEARSGDVHRIESLEPGIEMRFELVDVLGEPLTHVEVTAPAWGTHATCELRSEAPVQAVVGVVRDRAGAALDSVEVVLEKVDAFGEPVVRAGGGMASARAVTDDRGRFEFAPVASGHAMRLTFRGAGYVMRVVELPVGHAEDVLCELHPGRTVTVRVVDDAGEAVDLRSHTDAPCRSEYEGLGVTRFDDLAPAPAVFATTIGGVVFRTGPDDLRGELHLVVPRPGRLRLTPGDRWPGLPDGERFRARVTRLDRGQPVQTMFVGKDLDLLPGRYRVELLATRGGEVAPLGLSCEVDVAAGELVAATPR